jgi:HSP20 family molecular chaperone IbpA
VGDIAQLIIALLRRISAVIGVVRGPTRAYSSAMTLSTQPKFSTSVQVSNASNSAHSSALARLPSSEIARPRMPSCRQERLPVEIAENKLAYGLIVPLSGIDPRKIYVLAGPRSLLVEFRMKDNVRHASGGVAEKTECRISREFTVPDGIEAHSTTVRVCGDSLQITARKAREAQQGHWSELVRFDV